MIRQLSVALAMLVSPTVLAAQTAATPAAALVPKVDDTTQAQDVQFANDATERMTVPVRVSGTGPFRFLVDTGADRTAISRELASRLGLVRGPEASVHTVGGVTTVATADVPNLELTRDPMRVKDAPLLDGNNIGADGILGVDSLRSQRVQFDFAGQTMEIVPSATHEFADEPGTIIVKATRKNGRLVVADATANGRNLTVVIDTGAQVSIGNEALRKQLLGRGLVDTLQTMQLLSVTGELVSGDYMFVRDLEIGGVTLHNLAIVFADAHTFGKLGLDRKPALLLGMNAIRAFKKVSIDFANRKFKVVLPESSELDIRMASTRLR